MITRTLLTVRRTDAGVEIHGMTPKIERWFAVRLIDGLLKRGVRRLVVEQDPR